MSSVPAEHDIKITYLNYKYLKMNTQQLGFSGLLKDGYRHYAGLEEAVYKNINACRDISKITRTSLGPNGMKKMVINYLEKAFVTSDAATVLKELEV